MNDTIKPIIQGTLANYGIIVPEGDFLIFLILVVAFTVVLQLALMIIRAFAKFASGKTATTIDDEIVHVFSKYFPVIAFLTSLLISVEVVYPDLMIGDYDEFEIYVMLLLAVLAFLIAGIVDAALVWYGMKIQPPKRKQLSRKHIFPFVRNVIKVAVFILFGVFILQVAKFDTTALITGLGIGGLAVALALQGTLSNFFGGVHILIDKPFREGDYIILEDGQEGVVDRIGWRTTKIITLGKDEVVIPNAKLAESIIKNESTPKEETGVLYTIGVSYDSDVDKVVEAIKNAVKNVQKKNENLVPDSVWARLDSYGDYALNFKFGYLVYGYKNQYGVLADINREIFNEFKKKKIDIPYPIVVVKKPKGKKK